MPSPIAVAGPPQFELDGVERLGEEWRDRRRLQHLVVEYRKPRRAWQFPRGFLDAAHFNGTAIRVEAATAAD